MSITMDSNELPETYADIRSQQIRFKLESRQNSVTDGTTASDTVQDVEIMEDEGGLDHNQVAELIGFTFDVDFQMETTGVDTGEFALTPNSFQIFGHFGANLDDEELLGRVGNPDLNESVIDAGHALQGGTQDEDGIFHSFVETYDMGFLDTGNGYAGGSSHSTSPYRLIYPVDMGVRGPVLDENDDLSLAVHAVKEGTDITVEAEVRITCFYSTMEIEGVRNDFDMPQ